MCSRIRRRPAKDFLAKNRGKTSDHTTRLVCGQQWLAVAAPEVGDRLRLCRTRLRQARERPHACPASLGTVALRVALVLLRLRPVHLVQLVGLRTPRVSASATKSRLSGALRLSPFSPPRLLASGDSPLNETSPLTP